MNRLPYFILVVVSSIFSTDAFGQQIFNSSLSNLQTIPISDSTARAFCRATVASSGSAFDFECSYSGVAPGSSFGAMRDIPPGTPTLMIPLSTPSGAFNGQIGATSDIRSELLANQWYFQISSPSYPNGEIRGRIKLANGTYNDYDGDGRTDVQVYRNSQNTFYARRSTDGGFIQQALGESGDSVSLTVDWDGDGRSDFSTARYSADILWRILPSSTNALQTTSWGSSSLNDFFAAGDYDGDGRFDIAVFRAGLWCILESSTGNVRYETFGQSGDVPAANDYDGDGKVDLTIARSEGGNRIWWTRNSSDGQVTARSWGLSSDAFFTGRTDFDGDGKCDLLVIRNQSGQRVFYALRSSDGQPQVYTWGLSNDVVKLGDYDGDGRTDPTVTRGIGGERVFFILQSTTGSPRVESFGLAGDF